MNRGRRTGSRPRTTRVAFIATTVLLTGLILSRLLPWRPYPPFPDNEFVHSSRLLFVMAHHDDELVRLVRMRRLNEAGHEIHVAWLARDHYRASIDVGLAESRCAMQLVGVPAGNLHYLPDALPVGPGAYLDQLPLLTDYLASLLQELRPAALFVNAYEGGHVEHDIAHVATVLAASRTNQSVAVVVPLE